MRILSLMMLAVMIAAPAMAKDDGGFGSSRFSAQTPVALSGEVPTGALASAPAVPSPADIEPAAGEEDVTPEEEVIDNQSLQNSEHQTETIIIKKDLSVR